VHAVHGEDGDDVTAGRLRRSGHDLSLPPPLAGIKRTGAKKSLVRESCQGDARPMFTVNCAGHGGRVLLDESAITALVNTKDTIELHWRCSCGTEGVDVVGAPAGRAA
jgi:hypothetical protein